MVAADSATMSAETAAIIGSIDSVANMYMRTGSVTVWDGAKLLGSVALTAGQSTLLTNQSYGGAQTIQAVYSGDANFAAASGTDKVTSTPAKTTLTLSAAPKTAPVGNVITLTAKVTAKPAVMAGTVSFSLGKVTLGSAGLNSLGVAVLKTSSLPPGTDTVTASFPGTASFTPSSGSVAVTITP